MKHLVKKNIATFFAAMCIIGCFHSDSNAAENITVTPATIKVGNREIGTNEMITLPNGEEILCFTMENPSAPQTHLIVLRIKDVNKKESIFTIPYSYETNTIGTDIKPYERSTTPYDEKTDVNKVIDKRISEYEMKKRNEEEVKNLPDEVKKHKPDTSASPETGINTTVNALGTSSVTMSMAAYFLNKRRSFK